MNDPALVGSLERLRDLFEDRQRLVRRQRSTLDPFGERFARHQFHLEECGVADLLESVQRGDVGVIERREHTRFALESALVFGVVRRQFVKNLDGDFAAEPDVLGAIHFAHPSGAERRQDAIGTDGAARRKSQAASLLRIIPLRPTPGLVLQLPRMSRRPVPLASNCIWVLVCAWLPVSVVASQTPQPTPRPVPVAPPQTQVEASARDALQQYSTALESLDADQVKKIQPAVDAEGLRRAFREMRELKVTIDNVKVLSTEGPIARVSCRVTQVLTPRAGARQTTAVTRVMRLKRQEGSWVIDGFER